MHALKTLSRHDVRTFNPSRMDRSRFLEFAEFDAVVIHYSIVPSRERMLAPDFSRRLAAYQGVKAIFRQDEYCWVDQVTAEMRKIGISLVFTVAPEPAASQLYGPRLPGAVRHLTLTGFVSEELARYPVRPMRDRPIDIGYRGRSLPFWLGELTQEKLWIGQRVRDLAPQFGLRRDIAWREEDRIYGRAWIDFISGCRATLGTESGASIADFDGSVEREVRTYLAAHPRADFTEVSQAVLASYEGNVVVNVISPRIFEAAALRTALVMFPGDYSGIVKPWDHYIPLEKDFSNFADVAAHLKDSDFLEELTARAYRDVVETGRYTLGAFVRDFDDVLDGAVRPGVSGPAVRYRLAGAERSLSALTVKIVRAGFAGLARLTGVDFLRRVGYDPPAYAGRAWQAAWTLGRNGDLRRLFRVGRSLHLPLDRLLKEILELAVLRRIAELEAAARPFGLDVNLDADGSALHINSVPGSDRLVTTPADAETRTATRDLERLSWDHRRIGVVVRAGKIEVAVGSDGFEQFTALLAIGRHRPAVLAAALRPLIRAVGPADPISHLKDPS